MFCVHSIKCFVTFYGTVTKFVTLVLVPTTKQPFSLSCHPIFVFPIKCFYILGNCWKMVHSSVHPIKCFYILGNCYKMCPIKCFYILCSVSNVAMVSWLTLLYVLRSFHKMFFNILGNCYPMYSMVHHLSIRRYTNYKNVCQHVYQIYSQTLTHCNTCCYPRVRNTMEHVINKLTMVGTTTFLRCRF